MKKRPLLVMIPGLDGTGYLFGPVVEVVHHRFEILIVKYPDEPTSTLLELANFVKCQIPEDRDLVIIAESFGGPIALNLLANGLIVRACVFCATFSKSPRAGLVSVLNRLPINMLPKLIIPSILAKRVLLGSDAQSDRVNLLKNTIQLVEPRVLRSRISILSRLNLLTELKEAPDIPYLFIQPTNDLLVPRELSNPFKLNLERVDFLEVEGGHFILQSNPIDCWRAIDAFLAKLNI